MFFSELSLLQRPPLCWGQWVPVTTQLASESPSTTLWGHPCPLLHRGCPSQCLPKLWHQPGVRAALQAPLGLQRVLSPCVCGWGDGASGTEECLHGEVADGWPGCLQPPKIMHGRCWGNEVTTLSFTCHSAASGLWPVMEQERQLHHQFPCDTGTMEGLECAEQTNVQSWSPGLRCEPDMYPPWGGGGRQIFLISPLPASCTYGKRGGEPWAVDLVSRPMSAMPARVH